MDELEQKYYEMLTRTDHPVFAKDFSTVTTADSPFNSIMNRCLAKALVRMRVELDLLILNAFPDTVQPNLIDFWEQTYFGFTKPSVPFEQRVAELLRRYNHTLTMSVQTVIFLAEIITGQTPIVIRNLYSSGWILDVGILDVSTVFSGPSQNADGSTYVVIFSQPIDSTLKSLLDKELTRVEKGGSSHVLIAPSQLWVLDASALGVNTILG